MTRATLLLSGPCWPAGLGGDGGPTPRTDLADRQQHGDPSCARGFFMPASRPWTAPADRGPNL